MYPIINVRLLGTTQTQLISLFVIQTLLLPLLFLWLFKRTFFWILRPRSEERGSGFTH
ncbi:MAG: hypothetical protein HQ485_11880 [Acidobacteria bacterium]|jgi:hypothetical protein|nr:hypothetical protein [Acidobacteriota bacterium]